MSLDPLPTESHPGRLALERYLFRDSGTTVDPEVARHVADCEHCRGLLR